MTRLASVCSTVRSRASKREASASGSWKGIPGASISDTPCSGIRNRTGPSQALSLAPIHSPIRAFSSAVVRISVTLGLWMWKVRPSYCAGTVSRAPKFTMSSAPHEPT